MAWCESLLCRNMIACAVIVLAAVVCRADTKRVWRDANGRILGTETTDSMGRTTYRDSNGMLIGTARTDGNGRTTYRDSNGQLQGTAMTDSAVYRCFLVAR